MEGVRGELTGGLWCRLSLTAPYRQDGQLSHRWLCLSVAALLLHVAATLTALYFHVTSSGAANHPLRQTRLLSEALLTCYRLLLVSLCVLSSAFNSEFVQMLHTELTETDSLLSQQHRPHPKSTYSRSARGGGAEAWWWRWARVTLVPGLLLVYVSVLEYGNWYVLTTCASVIITYAYQVRLAMWMECAEGVLSRVSRVSRGGWSGVRRLCRVERRLRSVTGALVRVHRLEISLLLLDVLLGEISNCYTALSSLGHHSAALCTESAGHPWGGELAAYFVWLLYGAHQACTLVLPFASYRAQKV